MSIVVLGSPCIAKFLNSLRPIVFILCPLNSKSAHLFLSMILKHQHNTPVSAPQIGNVETVLTQYRTWKGFAFLTIDDLFAFMINPGSERDEFLSTLNMSVRIVKTDFATQTFE